MVYYARTIKDRVAVGDDCFYMEQLEDGRVRLIPAPDSVQEVGTDVNKDLLQLIEDRVVLLMNTVFNDISANPFRFDFDTLAGASVDGIWNEELSRVEC